MMRPLCILVLRAIADDYESFDIIINSVSQWAASHGGDHQSIKSALEQLIDEGYAQAYVLSSEPPARPQAVKYSDAALYDLWFYVTEKGKALAREMRDTWSEDLRIE
jgi:hypothetical protein